MLDYKKQLISYIKEMSPIQAPTLLYNFLATKISHTFEESIKIREAYLSLFTNGTISVAEDGTIKVKPTLNKYQVTVYYQTGINLGIIEAESELEAKRIAWSRTIPINPDCNNCKDIAENCTIEEIQVHRIKDGDEFFE